MSATENLAFSSIRIKNYRQFYGDSGKIDLKPKNGKMINIIQGENGWGKSNFLNAVNYCLFLDEPHLKKENETMTFLSTRAIDEAKDGDEIEMIIELELGNEKTTYRIDRRIAVVKGKLTKKIDPNSGEEIVDTRRVASLNALLPVGVDLDIMQTSFKFADKGMDWNHEDNFVVAVDRLLPDTIKSLFFLDGELLESLNTTFEGVELGVKELANISLLEKISEHLPKVLKDYEKKTRGQNKDQDELLKQKNRQDNWLESLDDTGEKKDNEEDRLIEIIEGEKTERKYHPYSGIPRKKSKEKERAKIKARLEHITGLLQKSNSELVTEWAKELESIAKELPLLEEQLSTRQNEKLDWIVAFTPQVFLHQCIKYTCDLVDTKRKKGQLPVKYNEIFYNDLLKKGECICGTSISDNTAAKENIRKWHDVVKEDERLDAAVEASADFKAILKSLPKDVGKIDEFRRKIDELIERVKKMRDRKKELELNLAGAGKDEEEIEDLREEYGAKETIKSDLDTEIAGLKVDIKERERLRNLAQTEYKKVLKANTKKNEAIDKLEISQTLIDSFEEVIKTVTKKLRESVGETTKNSFFNLIGKKKGFKNVSLNEDYRLTVTAEGKTGNIYDATGNLSAGEKLCLALSYISAIKDMTGYQMPLIIDTPLAKISGKPKTFVAQRLPKFLSNTQLTLLVTDTEYQSPIVDKKSGELLDPVRKIIKENVSKEYDLEFDDDEKSTSFKPMRKVK